MAFCFNLVLSSPVPADYTEPIADTAAAPTGEATARTFGHKKHHGFGGGFGYGGGQG